MTTLGPERQAEHALELAVSAAATVANRTAATPVEAAMEVACAFLVAREQMRRASREANRSPEDVSENTKTTDALLRATGFDGVNPVTTRAMTLLGLQPLLRIRQSIDPSPVQQPAPQRERGFWGSFWFGAAVASVMLLSLMAFAAIGWGIAVLVEVMSA